MVMSEHLAVVLISNTTRLSNNRLNSFFAIHTGCMCCPIDTHIFGVHESCFALRRLVLFPEGAGAEVWAMRRE